MLALYFHWRFNRLFFLFTKESPMNSPRSWLFGGWKVSWWVWPEKYDPSQRDSAPRGISDAENIVFNTCSLAGKTNQFTGIQENKVRGNHSKSIFSQLLLGFKLYSSIIMSTFSARILYWVTIWHWIDPKNKNGHSLYSPSVSANSNILTIENILESWVVELENMEGIMKFRRDISSKRLFCKGVPVSSKRCSAYTEAERASGLDKEYSDERQRDFIGNRHQW